MTSGSDAEAIIPAHVTLNGHTFTRHEIEVAIAVLGECKIVRNWVDSEMEFVGHKDMNSAAAIELKKKLTRAGAVRIIMRSKR